MLRVVVNLDEIERARFAEDNAIPRLGAGILEIANDTKQRVWVCGFDVGIVTGTNRRGVRMWIVGMGVEIIFPTAVDFVSDSPVLCGRIAMALGVGYPRTSL